MNSPGPRRQCDPVFLLERLQEPDLTVAAALQRDFDEVHLAAGTLCLYKTKVGNLHHSNAHTSGDVCS